MSRGDTKGKDRGGARRPAPIPAGDVTRLIREVLERDGPFIPTDEFRKRGRERNFDIQDALEVFRTFATDPKAVWNDTREAWNYDVKGVDLEGESLTVRVAFSPTRSMAILVTGF